MPGAMIELRQQASYPGAANVLVTTTTTDAKGEWKLRVPRGPSRVITVGYRSRSNNPAFAKLKGLSQEDRELLRSPDASEAEKRKIVRENVAQLYGFDFD